MPKLSDSDRRQRQAQILAAAIEEAKVDGYQWVRRELVAKRAGVSVGLVNSYYGTMIQLKRAVMRAAVEQRIVPLVAQGLADGNEHALKADADLKAQAAQHLQA